MALGLGNNLIRNGGAGNPDGLSLDLQFATDKTLVARKGPTPVFIRGSSATQVGASGLIEYAPENLILRSQESSFWGITGSASKISTDSAVAPDGTMTADVVGFSGASGYLTSTVTSMASPVSATISCWVRVASETALFRLQIVDAPSPNFTATTTWQRFSHTGSLTSSYSGIRAASDGSSSTLEVWGLQVERSSTARAYIPTTTAVVYGARFDHDPITLACKGLLIEEQRVNALRSSSRIDTSPWGVSGSSTVATGETAPDGSLDGALITTTAAGNGRSVGTISLASGTSYALSCYFKAGTASIVRHSIFDGAASTIIALNLSTLVVSTISGTLPYTSSVVTMPNGWYRFTVSFTAPNTTTGSVIALQSGASGSFIVWGAQLEAGSFPTSYIPTTTGPVTRSADVCSITSSTLWNTSEGALFTHSILPVGGYDCYPANWVNYFGHRRSATNSLLGMIRGGGTFDITLAASGIAAATLKIASSYGGGSQSAVYNNNTVVSQATAFTLSPTVLNLGANSPTTCINGHLTSVKYYRKKLSDAKLQTLTT